MENRKKLVEAAVNAYFACLRCMNSRNLANWHHLMGEIMEAGLYAEYAEAKRAESVMESSGRITWIS